jgi:predicted DNA-binding transcriptional regulator AlpA
MPTRKHREGAELEDWQNRKDEHARRLEIARETVKSLSGHTLLRLDEAAAMLSVTKKTLRELEAQRLPNWPARVVISPKVIGYKLADMQQYIDSCKAPCSQGEAA